MNDLGIRVSLSNGTNIASLTSELLTINETHEPEFYWALRGVGGGFHISGIRMQEYQSLLFNDKALNLSNNIFLLMNVNNIYAEILIVYFGIELEELNKTISLLLARLLTPNETNVRKQNWLTFVYEGSSIGGSGHDLRQLLLENLTYPTYYFKGKHLFYDQPISDHSLDQFIDRLALGDGQLYMEFSPRDGYLSTIPVHKTVFPHRHFKLGIQFMIYSNDEQQLNRLDEVYLSIYNDSTKYSYINYIDRDVPNWMNVYYHTHQQRLINIEHIYDKNNRFYFERRIESSAANQQTFFNFRLASFVIFVFFII